MFGIFYFENEEYKNSMIKYYEEHPESQKLGAGIKARLILGAVLSVAGSIIYMIMS